MIVGLRRRLTRAWTLSRVMFAVAGTLTVAGVALATAVSPWFLLLVALVGVNQLVFVAVGDCPASLVVRRLGIGDTR
jgi:hypothetical protein